MGFAIEQAIEQFESWMQKWNHPEQSDDKHLTRFLTADRGFALIDSYKAFCELGKAVAKKGYQTTGAPCTEGEFWEIVLKASLRNFRDEKRPVVPPECCLAVATEQFDAWMQKWNHPERSDDKHLTRFLTADSGFALVDSYSAFCKLGKAVAKRGYKTTGAPCTEGEFWAIVLKADLRNFRDGKKPEVPKKFMVEDSIQVAGLIYRDLFPSSKDDSQTSAGEKEDALAMNLQKLSLKQ